MTHRFGKAGPGIEKRINLICEINRLLATCTDSSERERLQAELKGMIPKEKPCHHKGGKKKHSLSANGQPADA